MAVSTNGNGVGITISAISQDAKAQMTALAKEIQNTKNQLDQLVQSVNEYKKSIGKEHTKTLKQMERLAEVTSKTKARMDELTKSAKASAASIEEMGNSANAGSKKMKTSFQSFINSFSSMKKSSFSLIKALGEFYAFVNFAKMLGSMFGDSIRYAMQWIETENLYVQSMKRMSEEGKKWVQQMSDTFGLATGQLMQYQATFKNMLGNLNALSEDQSYELSKTLSIMALDYASLFNFDYDEAMEKFQSALAQQTKAIRSVAGFDITEKSLQLALDQAGIDLVVKNLSTVEKRLAIILALQQQLENSGAMGDFARTIEQPANQLKILKQQLIEVATWIGRLIISFIKPALVWLIALTEVIKNVIRFFALLIGKPDDFKDSTFKGIVKSAGAAQKEIENTGKAADKLKRKLAGFDEMTIIGNKSENANVGGTGDVGGIGGGINPKLLESLNNYKTQLDNISTKSKKIVNDLMSWLGFTKQINEETGLVEWKMENYDDSNLKKIITAIKVIGVLLSTVYLGAKIKDLSILVSTFVKKTIESFTVFGKLFATGGKLHGITTFFKGMGLSMTAVGLIIAILVAAFVQLMITSEGFRKSVQNSLKELGNLIKNILIALKEALMPVIDGFIVAWNGFVDLLEPFFTIIVDIFTVLFRELNGVVLILKPILRFLGEIIGLLLKIVGVLLSVLGKAILWLYNEIKKGLSIFDGLYSFVGKMIDDFVNWFNGLSDSIRNFANNASDEIRKFFDNLWNGAKNVWNDIKGLFDFGSLFNNLGTIASNFRPFGIRMFANGGFPQQGQLFFANERGPELVGNIGGRTAVANNNMIVNAIYNAVYDAMRNADVGQPRGNSNLKVFLNTKDVTNAVVEEINATTRRTGENPLAFE